ncbi:type II toxin-antitoxin system YoeB family toxin [Dyadobacter bucti]|uniref:type II toxin-antitoxin system YoeB family toxin n=1 Tax=Dyadobacter bucti TaxID=2572203 RepID=UPI0011082DAD
MKWINTFSRCNVQNCFIEKAEQDLYSLLKSEPKVYKKAILLLKEIEQHPRTGRGKPMLKRHDLEGLYARKITDKHRLVYYVND